jgi:hypothetical protein
MIEKPMVWKKTTCYKNVSTLVDHFLSFSGLLPKLSLRNGFQAHREEWGAEVGKNAAFTNTPGSRWSCPSLSWKCCAKHGSVCLLRHRIWSIGVCLRSQGWLGAAVLCAVWFWETLTMTFKLWRTISSEPPVRNLKLSQLHTVCVCSGPGEA